MASKDAGVDKDLVHPQLATWFQDQGGLDPAKLAALGFHGFAAVQVLPAELEHALIDARTVQYQRHPLDRGHLLVGVPAGMALVGDFNHVWRGWVVRLDGIHQQVLVRIAVLAPQGLVRRLVGF
ncbi:hypothetical protein, partial [Paenarthrobacter sp. CM16]|uniref:hypothetical protein n=1 Tax=Paenarthrobacter sp. CM16 TaxID=2738447 RepID=UPI001553F3A1